MLFCFYANNSIPFLSESQTITFDMERNIHLNLHNLEIYIINFFYNVLQKIYFILLWKQIMRETHSAPKKLMR